MNEQPEALRLADAMLNYWDERGPDAEAVAAELRRLHEENQTMRNALRQAVDVLEFNQARWQGKDEAITEAKQALGEQT